MALPLGLSPCGNLALVTGNEYGRGPSYPTHQGEADDKRRVVCYADLLKLLLTPSTCSPGDSAAIRCFSSAKKGQPQTRGQLWFLDTIFCSSHFLRVSCYLCCEESGNDRIVTPWLSVPTKDESQALAPLHREIAASVNPPYSPYRA